MAQGLEWIDAGGSARGQPAGQQGDAPKEQGHHGEGGRVVGLNSIQERGEDLSHGQGSGEAEHRGDQRQ